MRAELVVMLVAVIPVGALQLLVQANVLKLTEDVYPLGVAIPFGLMQ